MTFCRERMSVLCFRLFKKFFPVSPPLRNNSFDYWRNSAIRCHSKPLLLQPAPYFAEKYLIWP